MDEPIEDLYFNWLYAKVLDRPGTTPNTRYQSLLYLLHTTEFVWTLSGDDNRAEEGKDLRRQFMREARVGRVDPEWLSMGCSVLEMLIAFARRAAFETEKPEQDWFWLMMENLGIDDISEATYRENAVRIGDVMHTLVWRTYDHLGRGGLFPLSHSDNDQRDVQIWYQFAEYVVDQGIT